MSEVKSHPWTTLMAATALGLVIYANSEHARASDVAAALAQLRDIRAAQVEDKIINARTRACHSTDDDQRRYFEKLAREYKDEYLKITGMLYVMPSCNEV